MPYLWASLLVMNLERANSPEGHLNAPPARSSQNGLISAKQGSCRRPSKDTIGTYSESA